MGCLQILQCLFIPFTGLPQLFHFLIGTTGKEFADGMFQCQQFGIILYACHYIEQFQLCFIKNSSVHCISNLILQIYTLNSEISQKES